MKYLPIVGIAALLAIGLSSCDKMLGQPSKRAVAEVNMWQNESDARAATSACYALMRAAMLNENAYWVYGELRAGDFEVTSQGDLTALRNNQLNANYATMDEWRDWRRFYAAIAQCNLAIENLPKVPGRDYRYSVQDMKLDLSQVIFIRAFLYFYLVRIWGDVPLILKSTDGTFSPIARTPSKEVLDTAAKDALAAVEGLPWQYDGNSVEQQGTYRGQGLSHHESIAITKGMCWDLVAHIYDWENDYQDALTYCNVIIDNQSRTGYAFTGVDALTTLDAGFRGRVADNIFQVDMNFDHEEISTTGQLEDWTLRSPDIPKSQSVIYVSKDSILAIYNEPNDQRPAAFFTRMNDTYPEFYKMKQVNTAVTNPTLRLYSSAVIVFRYEELYLLRAECKARLGDIPGSITDLNLVRNERSLSQLSASFNDADLLLGLILQERRRELIGEGWRWYDLVHYSKVADYTSLSKAAIQQGAALWPISKEALSENSALVQNPYWK